MIEYFSKQRLEDLWARVSGGNYTDKIQMLNFISDFLCCTTEETKIYMQGLGIKLDLGKPRKGGKNGRKKPPAPDVAKYDAVRPCYTWADIREHINNYNIGDTIELTSTIINDNGNAEDIIRKWEIIAKYPCFMRVKRQSHGRTITAPVNYIGFWQRGSKYII